MTTPSYSRHPRTQQAVTRTAAAVRSAELPSGNYQPVILAEFIGVILVLALAPVARSASTSPASSSATFASPYAGSDMVKLAAATMLYVILGFISTASHGAARVAAWMGGLVSVAVLLAEGTTVTSELSLFSGGLTSAAAGAGNLIGPSESASGASEQAGQSSTSGAADVSGGSAQAALQPNASGIPVRKTGVAIT